MSLSNLHSFAYWVCGNMALFLGDNCCPLIFFVYNQISIFKGFFQQIAFKKLTKRLCSSSCLANFCLNCIAKKCICYSLPLTLPKEQQSGIKKMNALNSESFHLYFLFWIRLIWMIGPPLLFITLSAETLYFLSFIFSIDKKVSLGFEMG